MGDGVTGGGRSGPDAWNGLRVCVAGMGVSGIPAARALNAGGSHVTVVESRDGDRERAQADELGRLGIRVRLAGAEQLPEGTELVVTSPGWRPDAALLVAARRGGVPVIGEVELAWRMRPVHAPAPWLAVTGTNGKTSTVRMLASILSASGHRACAAGNVGLPLLDAVLADPPYEVLAVELSSFQLHWADSPRPFAAAVLNVAPDHLDWHGSLEAYAADKARIFAPGTLAVLNADDPASSALAPDRGRRVSFTLNVPASGQLGVEHGQLHDRAFTADSDSSDSSDSTAGDGGAQAQQAAPAVLGQVSDVHPGTPHNVANALAAAALARAYGVEPEGVRDGLRAFHPDPHRVQDVATVDGVRYVDDSKATNPHAAAASLAAFASVVWIAGGQLKGADVDDVVAASAYRLRGAVVIGADRATILAAFQRHAPDVPVAEVAGTETGVMETVVREAARLARRGDAVLLAPAGASFDMFTSYGARGDAFAAAVRLLAEERS